MTRTLLLISLFFGIGMSSALAEEDHRPGSWFGLFGNRPLGGVSVWSEFQVRMENENNSYQQILVRPGVLYKLNDTFELGFLLGYIRTGAVEETRPTLQLSHRVALGGDSFLSFRHRLEGRFLSNNPVQSLRHRTLIRYDRPLNPDFRLVIWDEPFLNLTDARWTGNQFFERNRFFLGAAYPFQGARLEFGYLSQIVPRRDLTIYEHLAVLYLFY